MTETRERRISHKELTTIVLRCRGCGGEIKLDWKNEKQRTKLYRTDAGTIECPLCEQAFDSAVHKAFVSYRDWWDRLEAAKQEVIFAIQEPIC